MSWEQNRDTLLQEMKVTKGARFNASERLRKRDRSRTYITSAASVAVIMLTVFPLLFHVPEIANSSINFLTITMSVIILVYSLLQYSSGDLVTADQHYRCALEINALRRSLRGAEDLNEKKVAGFSEKYDEILLRYNASHEPVDFETYKLDNPQEFKSSSEDKRHIVKDIKINTRAEDFTKYAVTSIIGSISLIIVIFTAYQSFREASEVKEKLLVEHEMQMRAQRAAVNIKAIRTVPAIPDIDKKVDINIVIDNEGNTRAESLSVYATASILPINETPSFDCHSGFGSEIGSLAPGQQITLLISSTPAIPSGQASSTQKELLEELKKGKKAIYITGNIEYVDVFAHRHLHKFCRSLVWDNTPQIKSCKGGNFAE